MTTEKIKQALHVGETGENAFKPTVLDAHRRMLSDGDQFLSQVNKFEKVVRKYSETNTAFLNEVGTFMTDSACPRAWQPELFPSPDVPTPGASIVTVPPPQENHVPFFETTKQQELQTSSPIAVQRRIEAEFLAPLVAWATAHASAKERLSNLEKLRLPYDAARRKMQPVHGAVETDTKKYQRMQHLKNKYGPGMDLFQTLDAHLLKHLTWLVNQASRLKGHFALLLFTLTKASEGEILPNDVLLPFPEEVLEVMPTDLFANSGYAEGDVPLPATVYPPVPGGDPNVGDGELSPGARSPIAPIEAASSGKSFHEPATDKLRQSLLPEAAAADQGLAVKSKLDEDPGAEEHATIFQAASAATATGTSSTTAEAGSSVDTNPFTEAPPAMVAQHPAIAV